MSRYDARPGESIDDYAHRLRVYQQGDLSAGFDVGVKSLQQLGAGAVAAAGDAMGLEGVRNWGVERYQAMEQRMAPYAEGRATRIEDIKGLGSGADWVQYTAGQVAPSILESLGSALIGATVGSAAPGAGTAAGAVGGLFAKGATKRFLAKRVADYMAKGATRELAEQGARRALARQAGATAAMFGSSYVMGVGDVYGETMDEAGRGNALTAFLGGVPYAALDSLTEIGMLGRIGRGSDGDKALARYAKAVLGTAAKEGATESAQEAVLMLAGLANGRAYDTDEVVSRLGNSFAAGALAGGLMGVPGGRRAPLTEAEREDALLGQLSGLGLARAPDEERQQIAEALADPSTRPWAVVQIDSALRADGLHDVADLWLGRAQVALQADREIRVMPLDDPQPPPQEVPDAVPQQPEPVQPAAASADAVDTEGVDGSAPPVHGATTPEAQRPDPPVQPQPPGSRSAAEPAPQPGAPLELTPPETLTYQPQPLEHETNGRGETIERTLSTDGQWVRATLVGANGELLSEGVQPVAARRDTLARDIRDNDKAIKAYKKRNGGDAPETLTEAGKRLRNLLKRYEEGVTRAREQPADDAVQAPEPQPPAPQPAAAEPAGTPGRGVGEAPSVPTADDAPAQDRVTDTSPADRWQADAVEVERDEAAGTTTAYHLSSDGAFVEARTFDTRTGAQIDSKTWPAGDILDGVVEARMEMEQALKDAVRPGASFAKAERLVAKVNELRTVEAGYRQTKPKLRKLSRAERRKLKDNTADLRSAGLPAADAGLGEASPRTRGYEARSPIGERGIKRIEQQWEAATNRQPDEPQSPVPADQGGSAAPTPETAAVGTPPAVDQPEASPARPAQETRADVGGEGEAASNAVRKDGERPQEDVEPVAPDAASGYGASNTVFTADAAKQARERIRKKLRRLNAGLDPEMLMDGMVLTGYHIEAGVRGFVDVAQRLSNDLGVSIHDLRPYLKAWYTSAREALDDAGQDVGDMDDAEAVRQQLKGLLAASTQAEDAQQSPGQGAAEAVQAAGPRVGAGRKVDAGMQPASAPSATLEAEAATEEDNAQRDTNSPSGPALGAPASTEPDRGVGRAGPAPVGAGEGPRDSRAVSGGDGRPDGGQPDAGGDAVSTAVPVGRSDGDPSAAGNVRGPNPVAAEGGSGPTGGRATGPRSQAGTGRIRTGRDRRSVGSAEAQPGDAAAGDRRSGGDRPGRLSEPQAQPAPSEAAGKPAKPGRSPKGKTFQAEDYRADPADFERAGSWRETARRNVEIIELARTIDAERRPATPAEQRQLIRYTGFGASDIRNKLFPSVPVRARQDRRALIHPGYVRSVNGDVWGDLAERLAKLPREWQRSLLRSTQYAHYTSPAIVRAMWGAVERLGFVGGRVLEPGSGVGAFPLLAPQGVYAGSHFTGIEMDGPTALISRLLLPQQAMLHADFVQRKLPRAFFDLGIGNPPFSQTKITDDPEYAAKAYPLHDYFFAKTLDRVRPGGLVVFVSSHFTMDKKSDRMRSYLAEQADLLGAIRLPQTAFAQSSGTEVVTDVLFLRKRLPGEDPAGQAWLGTAEMQTPEGPVTVNEYYAAHPEMILGQTRIGGLNTRDDQGRYINALRPGSMTVVSYEDAAALEGRFAKAVDRLPENVYSPMQQDAGQIAQQVVVRDFDPGEQREGVLYLSGDGEVLRVQDGQGVAVAETEKLKPAEAAWLADYVRLRDQVQVARFAQLKDEAWKAELRKLRIRYRAFVKTHGRVLAFSTRVKRGKGADGNPTETTYRVYKNRKLLRQDYDSPLVMQLEEIKEDGSIVDGPFLKDRTIARPATRRIKTPADALAVSLDQLGRLDIGDVARRYDATPAEAVEALGDLIYQDPEAGGEWALADAYLSGNVKRKLEAARVAADADPRFQRNIPALEAVQPTPLTPQQITVRLGAPWVPQQYVSAFATEVLNAGAVTYDRQTETWAVAGARSRSGRDAAAEFGTPDRTPSEILDAVLNQRPIQVRKPNPDAPTGSKSTVVDKEGTAAANEAANKMRQRFKSWVWTDERRASDLLTRYNERFNNFALRRFDGSHLTLPGVSLRFNLYPHQKRAIWRVIQTGNTYLAHAVGAGKTMEMIAAGMEQRRLGLIRKPMYVVPNHMLEQFSNEFLETYPLANILIADDENFHKERRKQFVAAAAMNNPDAVIITHSAFKRLGMREQAVAPIRERMLADVKAALEEAQSEGQDGRIKRKQLEQQIEQMERRFDQVLQRNQDTVVHFEDMGVDFLVVDEAHNHRKLDFTTNQSNTKGVDPNGSWQALDLYVKTRWLESQRPGRSFVMASGTPITNTMGELYTIQRFFAEAQMAEDGTAGFDAWASAYGDKAVALERNAAGRLEPVERFASFVNVPELMMRVRQFMDVLTSDQLGDLVKRPELEGGKPEMVIVPPTDELQGYMDNVLAPRLEASKRWKPSKEQPANPDPIIAITGDARVAAIDPRFIDPRTDMDGKDSALTRLGDEVAAAYRAGREDVYLDDDGDPEGRKGSTQILFFNMGLGAQAMASRGFDARRALTERMVAGGVPRNAIAWFDDANTDAKKEAIFRDMRSGRIAVLIGSAKKMGTGVNVQKRLKVLHYLDPPWYPADVEQPHGRIIRQKNQNEQVRIKWYATEGTYQSTQWQMVARKQRMIDQALAGDPSVRRIEDISEASQYEMAAALVSGDPRMLELAEAQREVERLSLLQEAHGMAQVQMQRDRSYAEDAIKQSKRRAAKLAPVVEALGWHGGRFEQAEIGGTVYTKRAEAGRALVSAFNRALAGWDKDVSGTVPLGTLNEVMALEAEIIVERVNQAGYRSPDGDRTKTGGEIVVSIAGEHGTLMSGEVDGIRFGEDEDPGKVIGWALGGWAAKLPQEKARAEQYAEEKAQEIERLNKRIGAPFEYAQELLEAQATLARLTEELAAEGREIPADNAMIAAARAAADMDWEGGGQGVRFSREATALKVYRAGSERGRYGMTFVSTEAEYASNFGDGNVREVRIAPRKVLDLTEYGAEEGVSADDLAERLQAQGVDVDAGLLHQGNVDPSDSEILQHISQGRDPAALVAAVKAAGYDAIKINEYVYGDSEAETYAVLDDAVLDADIRPSRIAPVVAPESKRRTPARGIEAAQAQTIVDAYLGKLIGQAAELVRVEVVQHQDDAFGPGSVDRLGLVRGAFDPQRGAIVLVADNFDSAREVRTVLRHEAIGHFGFGLLSEAERAGLAQRIQTAAAKTNRALRRLWREERAKDPALSEAAVAEEVFARAAEMEQGRLGAAWDRVLLWLRDVLAKLGLIEPETSLATLRGLARRMTAAMREGRVAGASTGGDARFSFSGQPLSDAEGLPKTDRVIERATLARIAQAPDETGVRFARDTSGVADPDDAGASPLGGGARLKGSIREALDDPRRRLGEAYEKALPALLGAVTLRQLSELAAKHLPGLAGYVNLRQVMETRRNEMIDDAGQFADAWEQWERKPANRRGAGELHKLIHESTLAQVDPADYRPLTVSVRLGPGEHFWRQRPATLEQARELLRRAKQLARSRKAEDKGLAPYYMLASKKVRTAARAEQQRRAALPGLERRFAQLSAGAQFRDPQGNLYASREAAQIAIAERQRRDKDMAGRILTPRELVDGDGNSQGWLIQELGGQDIYRMARDTYQRRSTDMMNALIARVRDNRGLPEENRRELINQIRQQFERTTDEAGNPLIGPYFPLQRFGRYFAFMRKLPTGVARTFTKVDGNPFASEAAARSAQTRKDIRDLTTRPKELEDGSGWILEEIGDPWFAMFESPTERRREVDRLKTRGYRLVSMGVTEEARKQTETVTEGFMAEAVDKLKASGDKDGADMLYQMYLTTLQQMSMRKHFLHRKGTAGYSEDALRAFGYNMTRLAHQVSKLEHVPALERRLAAIEEEVKQRQHEAEDDADKDATVANHLVQEVRKRHQWVVAPENAPWTNVTSSIGFFWYLGVTPGAALVNLTQTPIVAYPTLAARYGWRASASALTIAFRDVAAGFSPTVAKGFLTGRPLPSQAARLTADERRAMAAWNRSGVRDRTQAHNLAGIGDADNLQNSRWFNRSMAVVSALFHGAEVVNRDTTLLAGYRLARARGEGHEQAVAAAEQATWESHFDYSNANRARYMQGNIAKLLLMFRSYSQHMTWFMGRNLYLLTKGETAEVRREARAKFVGLMGMTGLFAGSVGLPMLGLVYGMLNILSAAFGDDDEPWDAEVEFRNWLAETFPDDVSDMLDRGPVNTVTGLDFASRVSLRELWWRSPDRDLDGAGTFRHVVEQLLGPMGGVASAPFQAADWVAEGQWDRAAEAMSPKFLKDALRAGRYAREGVLTKRGNEVVPRDELSAYELMWKALGLNPDQIRIRYDANSAVKRYEQRVVTRRARLQVAYALARMNGDRDAQARLRVKIRDFNQSWPQYPITPRTIRASIRSRQRAADESAHGIRVNRRLEGLREAGAFGD